MREILFRGKNFGGEWEYGVPVFTGLNNELAFMKQMHSYDHQVIPETVGQFTGFTDMNGKKIFEGDIVESWFTKRPYLVCFGEYTYVDGYEEENACGWYNEDENGYASTIECPDAWATVIGNIHDNPEFLNVFCSYGERREGE